MRTWLSVITATTLRPDMDLQSQTCRPSLNILGDPRKVSCWLHIKRGKGLGVNLLRIYGLFTTCLEWLVRAHDGKIQKTNQG